MALPPLGTMTSILLAEGPTMTTSSTPEIYCVKCRDRTESSAVGVVTMKKGRQATRAIRVVCGTKKVRMGAAG